MKKGYVFPTKKPSPPPARLEERKAELEMCAGECETKESFRKRVNERRKAQQLTIDNLARILDVNIERVRKWCYKGQFPEALLLIRLAVALDCDVDYLVGLQDEPRQVCANVAEVTGLSYDAAEVLRQMKKIGNPTLSVLSDMIEGGELLNCILSAAVSEYENGYIESGKNHLYVSAETLYKAEKDGVFIELAKFIDRTRAKNNLPAL